MLSAGSAVARGTKTNGSQWNRRVAGAADSGEEKPVAKYASRSVTADLYPAFNSKVTYGVLVVS